MSALLPHHTVSAALDRADRTTREPASRFLPLLQKALFHGCLGVLGALLLGGCALSALLSLLLPARLRRAAGRAVISGLARGFFSIASALRLIRLDLSALDALNAERGLIIAPNHPSMLDALLIASRVRRTGCIMKADLWDNPFLGAGARLAEYVRNDSTHSMIRQAAADLAAGGKLLIFPEGTRTTEPPVNVLKGGIALIAQRSGAPIQTVLIETNSPYLGKGWPLLQMPQFPLVYRATLGPRLLVGSDRHQALGVMRAFYREAAIHPLPSATAPARTARALWRPFGPSR